MELILPGHRGSLLPALHLLLPPVYMEVSVDNVFASLMRVPRRHRGRRRVKPRTTSHLGPQPGTRRCYRCRRHRLTRPWPSRLETLACTPVSSQYFISLVSCGGGIVVPCSFFFFMSWWSLKAKPFPPRSFMPSRQSKITETFLEGLWFSSLCSSQTTRPECRDNSGSFTCFYSAMSPWFQTSTQKQAFHFHSVKKYLLWAWLLLNVTCIKTKQ